MLLVYYLMSRTVRSRLAVTTFFLQLSNQSHTSYASTWNSGFGFLRNSDGPPGTPARTTRRSPAQRPGRGARGRRSEPRRSAAVGTRDGGAARCLALNIASEPEGPGPDGTCRDPPGDGHSGAGPHPESADAAVRLHRGHAATRPDGAFKSAGAQHRTGKC